MNKDELKNSLSKFTKLNDTKFTVGVCVHVPNKMRWAQSGNDDIWLQRHLGVYLNKQDRRIYKAAHKNRGVRLKRIVALEYTVNTGWHAHLCVQTPDHMSDEDLVAEMGDCWLRYVKKWKSPRFNDDRLFWAKQIKQGYYEYTIKNGKNILDGNIDWLNTYLG